jgi:hypothetical protein
LEADRVQPQLTSLTGALVPITKRLAGGLATFARMVGEAVVVMLARLVAAIIVASFAVLVVVFVLFALRRPLLHVASHVETQATQALSRMASQAATAATQAFSREMKRALSKEAR